MTPILIQVGEEMLKLMVEINLSYQVQYMYITERVFKKLIPTLESLLKKAYNEFHVNATNCSVSDAEPQINGSTDTASTYGVHILFPK